MFGPISSVVFDFDGTLVDTMPSVIRGLGEAVRVGTGRNIDAQELLRSFGPAPRDVLRRWMPAERVPAALQHWLDFQAALPPSALAPFPGIPEMLEALRTHGVRIAIFTGRDRASTEAILRAHGWWETYFKTDTILAGDDGLPTKPRPEGLSALLERLSFTPAQTLMVGDHPYDMQAGHAAGCKTAAALWDLPVGQGSQRSRFKEAWSKWDTVEVDLRLITPGSIAEWTRPARAP